MSRDQPRNLEASVKTRLLALAREQGEAFQSVLMRYAIERFLYRLSISPYQENFVLKGASLFALWLGAPHRPTRDLDLLGYGSQENGLIAETFQAICRQSVEQDGLLFNADTVQVMQAREDEKYAGLCVTFRAALGRADIPMQVDIGFGDAVFPEAKQSEMPTLLGFPAARLRTYPRETIVAEKCEAMVDLGLSNSRLKGFYDLRHLAAHFDFDGKLLCQALTMTFNRRETTFSAFPPPALTEQFYADVSRAAQWRAFWQKSGLSAEAFVSLESCIASLNGFLLPPLQAVRDQTLFDLMWHSRMGMWDRSE